MNTNETTNTKQITVGTEVRGVALFAPSGRVVSLSEDTALIETHTGRCEYAFLWAVQPVETGEKE